MNKSANRFLTEQLKKLSEQFPGMLFNYGYDALTEQHIVKVHPEEGFNDERYKYAEFDVIDEFITLFPAEDLFFVSSQNEHIKIDKILHQVGGKEGYEIEVVNDFSSYNQVIPVSAPFEIAGYLTALNREKIEIEKKTIFPTPVRLPEHTTYTVLKKHSIAA